MKNNKPCPKCREGGHDKTGDHLYRAQEGAKLLNFYVCRRCGYKEFLNGTAVDTGAPSEEVVLPVYSRLSMEDISKLPSVVDRNISMAMRKRYGVVSELSEESGEPVKHFYPVTVKGVIKTYKFRDIEKKKNKEKGAFGRVTKGVTNDTDFFGMKGMKGTPRHILITEGEEDAMAAQQMLERRVKNIHCMSLSDGVNSAVAQFGRNLDVLSRADQVYYCPDNDEPGNKVVESIVALMPNIRIVRDLSENDANAMLMERKEEEFVTSVLRSKKYVPEFLVEIDDELIKDVCVKPSWGRAFPWDTLNKWTYGMRDGEGMFVGAGVKIGKTEWLNELIKHRILAGDGDRPAVAKFEEKPHMTVKKLAGKLDGTCYHKPDVPFNMEDLRHTAESLKNTMYMYKAFGTANWDTVKLWIAYAVAEGAKTVIIDPVTKLTNHLNPSETETELRRISDELACMAHDLGFFYIVTCHLKAPPSGKTPHEMGGAVHSNQFRGSRAMMENCYYMLGIERNKSPDLSEEERNTSKFVLLDDRNFGNAGKFPVFYDKDTGDYLEASAPVSPHLEGF